MTDIIVIGGGIAGLSAAACLSPDANVTLLEAKEVIGFHASGRSAATFEPSYGAPSVQALSRASHAYLRTHDRGYLSPRGLLLLAKPDEEVAFRADLTAMALDEVTPDAALDMVPALNREALGFAAFHSDAQDIDTDRLMQGFARQLRDKGGKIVTRAKVEAIDRTDTGWHLSAAGQHFSAPLLVNAAGAWADQIAALAGIKPLGIVPHRRSMARIPAPGGHDVAGWPLFFGVGESWYAKPDAGCLLVSPADEDPVDAHDAWADDMTLAEGLARYEAMISAPVTRLRSSWAGLRSFAPDRTLVLGPDPDVPAFIWCAGQGGYGMQTSPAAGRLVADLVMGRASDLPDDVVAQLTPGRLR